MNCLECKKLEEAFESSLSKYIEARSAAYYRVSTELAAKKNVDMERARNDLEEHQLICASAAELRPPGNDPPTQKTASRQFQANAVRDSDLGNLRPAAPASAQFLS